MKRNGLFKYPALLVFVALASVGIASASAEFNLFSNPAASSEFETTVENSDMNGFSLLIRTDGLTAEQIIREEGRFTRLTLNDAGIPEPYGEPSLPVIRKFFQAPFGCEVNLSVSEGKSGTIDLASRMLPRAVLPVQAPVPKIPGARENAPFIMDQAFYDLDNFYPESLVRIEEAGIMRGRRLLMLEATPLRYNPAEGKIRGYPELRIRVDFSPGERETTIAASRRYASRSVDTMVEKRIINSGAFSTDGGESLPIVYLVICRSSAESGLAEMLEWKELKGFKVVVATENDIASWTNTGIKAYIQNAYDNWAYPPSMILLVGDTPQIPSFDGDDTYSVADLYFVTLDGSDYLPDVGIGRFPAVNSAQLAAMTSKVVEYETLSGVVPSQWFEKAVFMASEDNYQISEGTHNYVIENFFEPAGLTCDKIYAHSGGGTQDIKNSLNNGRTIANYSGHGSTDSWSNPGFSQSDVTGLGNDGMLPFVISNSCLTGNFEVSECFGETWLRTEGNGAIGFWGGSASTYWTEDDILEKAQWQGYFEEDLRALHQMTDYALLKVYEYYGGGGRSQYYFEVYNILGDPSLKVWNHIPWDADYIYPPTIPIGPFDVPVNVSYEGSPVVGALVSLSQGDDVHTAAYTDESGFASIPVFTLTPDTVHVIVTGVDLAPHHGYIFPASEGAFVAYSTHLIDDDGSGGSYGNDDGEAGPGETLELPVALKNWGGDDASGVTATLSSADVYADVLDGYEEYGAILSGEEAWCSEDFDISIDTGCPDGHKVECNLLIEADGGMSWDSRFYLTVKAPVISFDHYDADDPAPGGNGNGVLEPGETGTLSVILRNEGLLQSDVLAALLELDDPYVSIINGSSEYPAIAPGGTGTNTTAFGIEISPDCPSPHRPVLTLTVTSDWYSAELSFELYIQGAGFTDDMESGEGDWTHGAITSGYGDQWHLSSQRSYSASHSWKCGSQGSGDYANDLDAGLVTPVIVVPDNATLTFGHWIDAETASAPYAFDGAIVEISTDEGGSWQQITPVGGYPYLINASYGNPLPGDTPCYSGSSGWTPAEFDLSEFVGMAMFRFRFGTDGSVTREGWYIDDVTIAGEGGVTIQLTPDVYSIQLGGTVNIDFTIENGSESAETFQVWTDITMPGGGSYPGNPHIGPVMVTLDPGDIISGTQPVTVPFNAPTGNYYYEGFAGAWPDETIDSSGFTLEVTE